MQYRVNDLAVQLIIQHVEGLTGLQGSLNFVLLAFGYNARQELCHSHHTCPKEQKDGSLKDSESAFTLN